MVQLNNVVKSLVKFLDNMDKCKRKKYLNDLGFYHCEKNSNIIKERKEK